MDIREKIEALRLQKISIKKAKSYLKELETKIIWAKQKISKIELVLNLTFEELEKLQKLKVKKLFTTVLVDKESQLEKKRQEYLEKFLHFKETKKSLDFLLYEKKIVLDKINAEDEIERKLKALLIQREEIFLRANHGASKLVIDVQIQIDICNSLNREIYEALIEGKRTKMHIATITSNLDQAKTLRNFTFINENEKVYTDEKQHVDKAMEAFFILKPIIRKFEIELEDIYKNHGYHLSINLDKLTAFTKKYYNYLINDWIIYEKINVAAKNMKDLEIQILDIISRLEREKNRNMELLKKLMLKKQNLLDFM